MKWRGVRCRQQFISFLKKYSVDPSPDCSAGRPSWKENSDGPQSSICRQVDNLTIQWTRTCDVQRRAKWPDNIFFFFLVACPAFISCSVVIFRKRNTGRWYVVVFFSVDFSTSFSWLSTVKGIFWRLQLERVHFFGWRAARSLNRATLHWTSQWLRLKMGRA